MQVVGILTLIIFFSVLYPIENSLFLSHTQDGAAIEFYDCFIVQDLPYCRRPRYSIDLDRTHLPFSCDGRNSGIKHRFSKLKSSNITISTILHGWKSSLEQIEAFQRYSHDHTQPVQELCQCQGESVFGKYCEYELPFGTKFEETSLWQVKMGIDDEWKLQIHGNITCYEGIKCDSGVLCLDWREICDGTQNCMFGLDEENCDILELNICEDDEYRCSNGMCIPDEYFVDGDLDCLDWTDEMKYWDDDMCPWQSVSIECDDHVCLRNRWSCGDGQCISSRLYFQTDNHGLACNSRRDHYFMCETHVEIVMWTMPNGRCNGDEEYSADLPTNATEEERCEYLLKCALSQGAAEGCPCERDTAQCNDILSENCSLPIIQYPKGAWMAPFLFFYFDAAYRSSDVIVGRMLVNGTVKCRHSFVHKNTWIRLQKDMTNNGIISEIFCYEKINLEILKSDNAMERCFRTNESTDICNEWNPCLSITRIKDGSKDCLNGRDEANHGKEMIDKTCSRVQHHRFCCSIDQPTCFLVRKLGDFEWSCQNQYDEMWRGTYRSLLDIECNPIVKNNCSFVRQYITQSQLTMDSNDPEMKMEISFRSYCDTFWDLKSTEDENLEECARWWRCTKSQDRCNTGQCIEQHWVSDFHMEWDCADASDEQLVLESISRQLLNRLPINSTSNVVTWTSETCHSISSFLCLSPNLTHQRQVICLNFSQLGDHKIDCFGAIDERNTLRHCSSSSAMLGYHFLCASTNTCIPFFYHCQENYRCPNPLDDSHWCSRSVMTTSCDSEGDFVCFDGKCARNGRCNGVVDCRFGEDEYMCVYYSLTAHMLSFYRVLQKHEVQNTNQVIDLPLLPAELSITSSTASVTPTPYVLSNIRYNRSSLSSSALLAPYVCNRGIGILSSNDSIVCFCPPQYYGSHCEYHADRLLVLLHLNLSKSIYTHQTDPSIVIKLLVLMLFHDYDDDQVLMTHEFHVRPASDLLTIKKKRVTFPYSRSSRFRQHRQDRHDNRSAIIHSRPYSIRIEAYQMNVRERSFLIAIWQYPIIFDYLPVFRLVKVLHLTAMDRWSSNPCSSQPCPPKSLCHPLMNDQHRFVCLCKPEYTGKNCTIRDVECVAGHCTTDALCLPKYRSLLRGNSNPYCVCPLNRYGDRCDIIHDYCQLNNPCLNGGSCQSTSRPNRVFCLCREEYRGERCEREKTKVRLSIMDPIASQGAIIQDFQIDYLSLKLILVYAEVYKHLPKSITHFHDAIRVPEIVIAKLYYSHDQLLGDLYLLSVTQHGTFAEGTANFSDQHRCKHIRIFSNVSSPIQYHDICIKNHQLICFHDDQYLCICGTNHTHVECFLYDDRLDRCSNCLSGGRCLRGHHQRSNDYLCVCPPCYSGRRCQFNGKSFAFTLDQLLYADLTSAAKTKTIIFLTIISLISLLLAISNNLCSFVTLRRQECLRNGVGHYLLSLTFVNQITLTLLIARLVHIMLGLSTSASQSILSDLFCKVFAYSLTSFARLSFWLSTFVTLERVYTTVFITKQWFKQPHIARRLIIIKITIILISASYELIFTKSFSNIDERSGTMCVTEFPLNHQTLWTVLHQIITVSNFLLPILINIVCTLTIIVVVLRTKMNLHQRRTDKVDDHGTERHPNVILEVLSENKELIARPAITLIPSLFSLFSLPLFIMAFAFVCQNLEQHPLRHLLLTFYLLIFVPSMMTFILYIYPSSFYWNQWLRTKMSRRIVAMRKNRENVQSTAILSISKNRIRTTIRRANT